MSSPDRVAGIRTPTAYTIHASLHHHNMAQVTSFIHLPFILFNPQAAPPKLRAFKRFATVPSTQLCALACLWHSVRYFLF